ncbi:MAG: DsrE family protein [Firmicutes bacterium]|nr:DsrE family protein [Bacillota bacterium]
MADAEKKPILVVLTTGKESFMRSNSIIQAVIGMKKFSGVPVEIMFLGPGVDLLRSNQRNSPMWQKNIESLKEAGVKTVACSVSLEGFGIREDEMFSLDALVMGGKEIAEKFAEGYHVMTF